MAYIKNGSSLLGGNVMHFAKALLLEIRIPYGQHFIHNKNIGFEVSCHGKGKAHIHSGGVAFYRCIDKLFYSGKFNDLVKFLFDLLALHTEKIAVEVHILATG